MDLFYIYNSLNKQKNLNPILHGGWFTEPPPVDDLS